MHVTILCIKRSRLLCWGRDSSERWEHFKRGQSGGVLWRTVGNNLWWWLGHYWCSCGLQTTGIFYNRCVCNLHASVEYKGTLFFRWDARLLFSLFYFFTACFFFVATIWGRVLFKGGVYFFGKPGRQQWQLDKVHTHDTVTTVRHCQLTHSLSVRLSPWKWVVQHEHS